MAKKNTDITKTGALTYKDLQQANENNFNAATNITAEDLARMLKRDNLVGSQQAVSNLYNQNARVSDYLEQSPFMRETTPSGGQDYFGRSAFDEDLIVGEQNWENISDVRAENQPWYSQLASGALKGFTTAGTTFVDGTLGLIYGLGKGIYDAYNAEEGEGWQAFGNALFNNEISAGLRDFSKTMEEILPNYRTKDEIENPYALRNIFSMNTFADDFLKNMGFTVGAFYSGNAFLGALRATKAAGLISTTAAKTMGSVLSGFNEGRIEAGNMYDDMVKAENESLTREARKRYEEIMSEPDTLIKDPETGIAVSSRQLKLQELQDNIQKSRENIDDRAQKGAIADLLFNTMYLPLTDAYAYGKLYARGFKPKKDLATKIGQKAVDAAAEKEVLEETIGKRIVREGKEYVAKPVSKRQATLRGLSIGVSEGLEEGNQSFFSALGAAVYSPDSPDAYYNSLVDPNYQMKSKDFMSALPEAWSNSWGGEDVWKEVGIGFLTGIIGMPTFGKLNNSDHNTYLGRGKTIGLSGGIFGEMANTSHLNQEAESTVNTMNSLVRKIDDADGFFTRSQAFTDAMDGWVEANDRFEFENANDNDIFNAIDAFGRTGRLADLRELVGEDFENMSDEELQDIAQNTEGMKNEWLNPDGTSMADTEKGRAEMREKLTQKRDAILKGIDDYEKALTEVRTIANSSLDDDQTRELAWLKWKIGKFEDRFKSIKEDNAEDINALAKAVEAFLGGRGRGMVDEESNEGKIIINNMEVLSTFLDLLNMSKSPLQVATLMKQADKNKLLDFFENFGFDLIEGMTGLDSQSFNNLMSNLKDTIRLANASDSFNKRYKEFMEDPVKVIQNRDNIDKKNSAKNEAANQINEIDKIRDSSVSDLSAAARNGDIDLNEMEAAMAELEGGDAEEQLNKVKTAATINQKSTQLSQKLDEALDNIPEGADPIEWQNKVKAAQAALEKATESAESVEDLTDLDTEVWLDPRNYDDGTIDPNDLADVVDEARSLMQEQLAELDSEVASMTKMPKSNDKKESATDNGETGHDPVEKVPTENERKAKEAKTKRDAETKQDLAAIYNEGITTIVDSIPEVLRGGYKADADIILADVNMLLTQGKSNTEIAQIIQANTRYKRLNTIDNRINNVLNDYLNAYRAAHSTPASTTNTTGETPTPRVVTPVIEVIQNTEQPAEPETGSSKVGGVYMYIRPATSEVPFNYKGGPIIPYYQQVKGTGKFTEAEERRMEAVYNYLSQNGAFQRVNEGRVKPGMTVGFKIDPELNEKAGDTVILIVDKDGKVIGDLPAKTNKTFNDYAGLADLVEEIEKEYAETGKITKTTTVDKNEVGKVPTTDTYSTLNAISEGKEFTLGIAMEGGSNPAIIIEGGRTKATAGDRDNQAMRPANAAAGQPFLMLETSSPTRHYRPVPIIMAPFGADTQGTQLHKVVEDVLTKILTGAARPTELKDELLDVLALEDAYIELNGSEVKFRAKKQGEGWVEIYKGPSGVEALPTVVTALAGTPYQVSRKFINGQFRGESYNNMIGEIARTNLPIGTTHTISDWFTLKLTNGQKTQSPRTTGQNPYRAASNFVDVSYKGVPYKVDTKSWEVTDSTGKVHTGTEADIIKAYAWGIHTNQDMTKPYPTSQGKFDPVRGTFVKIVVTVPQIDESLVEGLDEFTRQQGATPAPTVSITQSGDKVLIEPTESDKTDPEISKLIKNGKIEATVTHINTDGSMDVQYGSVHAEGIKADKITKPSIAPSGPETVIVVPMEAAPNPDVAELSEKEATDKVSGLIQSPKRQKMWEALSLESKRAIANKVGRPRATQWLDALEKVFNPKTNTFDTRRLRGYPKSVEEYLGTKPKYERVEGTGKVWNQEKEMSWLAQALPQFSNEDRVRLHNGLITIADEGGRAYGQFWRGIITISDKAVQGTMYHEAFHAVASTLLNEQELEDLFGAAQEKWGDIGMLALEEKMAEDFKDYVELEETPILGKAVKVYRMLKHFIQNLIGKEPYINKVYYNITRGKYADRAIQDTDVIRNSQIPTVADLQSILDGTLNSNAVWGSIKRNVIKRRAEWMRWKNMMENRYNITIKGYEDKNAVWHMASITPKSRFRKVSTEFVQQYHRDKLMYGNLSAIDRQFLEDKKITMEDYNKMSQKEKEVLFHCR